MRNPRDDRSQTDAQDDERPSRRRGKGAPHPYKMITPDGTLVLVSDDPDDIYANPADLPEDSRVLDTPAGTL